MSSPLAALLAGLDQGRPQPEVLARLGAPEPERAAGQIVKAAGHPDLAPTREQWLEPLLWTARPGFAAQCLVELANAHRERVGRALPAATLPSLARVLGSSDFLARLLLRRPEWSVELEGDAPDAPGAAHRTPPACDWTAIRQAKYRGLLGITARDLAGRPFEQSLSELSHLADLCLEAGLAAATPDEGCPPAAVFALGKLGGRELNFSSDVDLLIFYEPAPDADPLEQHTEAARLVRALKRGLEEATNEGFAYRVDLDLRPEGRTGAVTNPVSAGLHYYETFGSEWERQALLRLRHVAGAAPVARAFEEGIRPFVYRRLIDPDAIRRVRDMKARIESERRAAGVDLELDLKEGPGGIRDVEFLVQSLQLFHGGRDPSLRTGNVLEALSRLEAAGILPAVVTESLRDAYTWLRRAEHAVQWIEERQTARFPADPAARLGLARRLGYHDPDGGSARDKMLDDWTRVKSAVRAHFEALVLETEHGVR